MPLNLKTSKVWNYFDLKKADEAQCKHCSKVLLCKGGSTVGLKRVFEQIHDIILTKKKNHQIKVSLVERLASFAAIDGFSINAITKSNQICELLRDKRYTIPKSKTDVISLIYKYYMEIVEEKERYSK